MEYRYILSYFSEKLSLFDFYFRNNYYFCILNMSIIKIV